VPVVAGQERITVMLSGAESEAAPTPRLQAPRTRPRVHSVAFGQRARPQKVPADPNLAPIHGFLEPCGWLLVIHNHEQTHPSAQNARRHSEPAPAIRRECEHRRRSRGSADRPALIRQLTGISRELFKPSPAAGSNLI
jgi:hypothetical protein